MKYIRFSIIFMLVLLTWTSSTMSKEVSGEEIRDAILSLVHSYNLLDNKLERHEHRERALGELVKRALQSLQKGQKVFEPMNGIFARLDERVSQIETMLIAQEDKYNVQTDKLSESLERIFKWMIQNSACVKPGSGAGGNNSPSVEMVPSSNLSNKIDKLAKNVEEVTEISKTLLSQVQKSMADKNKCNEEGFMRLEEKLSDKAKYVAQVPVQQNNAEFEEAMKSKLNEITENMQAIKQMAKASEILPRQNQEYLELISNRTSHAIASLEDKFTAQTKALFENTISEVRKINPELQPSISKILDNLEGAMKTIDKFYDHSNMTYSNLIQNFEIFKKFDNVLLTTSEQVLDVQRKIEYGTFQVLQKVSELIRTQHSELNEIIEKRFNEIDSSIVTSHLESLQNLSSTMESEISHVWRQIEIMHNEISYSKEALNKLQGQTESYVNGTITTMDSMEGKVSHITERMIEIDSNLNYLLGKLSLVTQEFNQIKIGLGKALQEIRNSFKSVQDEIKDVGPGPHAVPKDEYETDINLLPQRDSS